MKDAARAARAGGPTRDRRRARAFFAQVLALLVLNFLAAPPEARAQEAPLPDAIPTAWHEAAGLTPLLTAPPPPNPATICIIDTGVTPTPDLTITARWAYDGGTLDDVRATDDSPGHGTLVAHFAAAAVNGWGGAGAFPHARITSVRVFPPDGGARWQDYIRAITRCPKLDPNTKVIVISIGGQEIEAAEGDELEAHIEQARNLYGVNVVAAAGNAGGPVDFPARFPATFAVAGTSGSVLCDFSARGPELDLAAPGCGLTQAGYGGALWSVSGTSFAAPIVAGVLGAVRSYRPALTAIEAEAIVLGAAAAGELPVVDGEAALRSIGVEPPGVDSREPEVQNGPAPATAPLPVETTSAVVSAPRRPARPRIRARRIGRTVVIRALNRPRGAALEVHSARRVIRGRAGRVAFRTVSRRARCRFITQHGVSPFTRVRW